MGLSLGLAKLLNVTVGVSNIIQLCHQSIQSFDFIKCIVILALTYYLCIYGLLFTTLGECFLFSLSLLAGTVPGKRICV